MYYNVVEERDLDFSQIWIDPYAKFLCALVKKICYMK